MNICVLNVYVVLLTNANDMIHCILPFAHRFNEYIELSFPFFSFFHLPSLAMSLWLNVNWFFFMHAKYSILLANQPPWRFSFFFNLSPLSKNLLLANHNPMHMNWLNLRQLRNTYKFNSPSQFWIRKVLTVHNIIHDPMAFLEIYDSHSNNGFFFIQPTHVNFKTHSLMKCLMSERIFHAISLSHRSIYVF